jgi:hypothetical protein
VAVDPEVALKLAYYKGQHTGVFAPRGWRCRAWYGSNGDFVIVAPSEIQDTFPAPPIAGPAVQADSVNGETSGRFEVADIAARFFPDLMRDYIQSVRRENTELRVIKPYPLDVVHRLNDRTVEFMTPANQEGFGTSGSRLAQSGQPIRGITALSPASVEAGLSQVFVRLPASEDALASVIIGVEAACLRGPNRC